MDILTALRIQQLDARRRSRVFWIRFVASSIVFAMVLVAVAGLLGLTVGDLPTLEVIVP